jgi:predicted nucleotidyltransferase
LFVQPITPENFWELNRDLEDALNLPVDLYTDTDEKAFIAKIITRGKVIYDASADDSE